MSITGAVIAGVDGGHRRRIDRPQAGHAVHAAVGVRRQVIAQNLLCGKRIRTRHAHMAARAGTQVAHRGCDRPELVQGSTEPPQMATQYGGECHSVTVDTGPEWKRHDDSA